MKKEKKPFEYYLIVLLFSILIILCFLQVVFRFILNLPLAWTEELSRYVFIALIYCGASSAAMGNQHVRVELIDGWIPKKYLWCLDTAVRSVCGVISLIISYYSIPLIQNAMVSNQYSASLQIPMWTIYGMVALMFLLIGIRFFAAAFLRIKHRNDGGDLV